MQAALPAAPLPARTSGQADLAGPAVPVEPLLHQEPRTRRARGTSCLRGSLAAAAAPRARRKLPSQTTHSMHSSASVQQCLWTMAAVVVDVRSGLALCLQSRRCAAEVPRYRTSLIDEGVRSGVDLPIGVAQESPEEAMVEPLWSAAMQRGAESTPRAGSGAAPGLCGAVCSCSGPIDAPSAASPRCERSRPPDRLESRAAAVQNSGGAAPLGVGGPVPRRRTATMLVPTLSRRI
mmetsp:Transcript_36602/g.80181  ORF Transcript_36602/g.80181 Transcript_36602/m.80181 type:complete len:235 (+) Transcript_36602:471-1175(+)